MPGTGKLAGVLFGARLKRSSARENQFCDLVRPVHILFTSIVPIIAQCILTATSFGA